MLPSSLCVLVVTSVAVVASASAFQNGQCRNHPGTGFNSTNMYLSKHPLGDSEAKCNDGSPAHLYFRPCCNGEDPGDFCNHSSADWLIVFGDGNQEGWCWDSESCSQRALQHPQLTSSVGLPQYFNRDGDLYETGVGAFCKGGESNPNFYPAYAAYIPYCSSDLFLGECTNASFSLEAGMPYFCGKSIVKSAIKSLLKKMRRYGADNIIFVGGAGVMNLVGELHAMMPRSATVTAVCDGCVLFDDLPPLRVQPKVCKDAFSCMPGRTLPDGVKLWKANLSDDCGGWRCLLSSHTQGKTGAVSRAAQHVPVLVQHPLYDVHAFSARGVMPEDNASLAAEIRSHIRKALSYGNLSVASACTTPQSSFTKASFLKVTFGAGLPPPTYATGLADLVDGYFPVTIEDSCEGVNCNPDCPKAVLPGVLHV